MGDRLGEAAQELLDALDANRGQVEPDPTQRDYRLEAAERHLRAVLAAPEPPVTDVCGCGHMRGAHALPDYGSCGFTVSVGEEGGDQWGTCPCEQFSARVQPQPSGEAEQ